MDFAPIRKQPAAEPVAPNLDDYGRTCAVFTWSGARGELAGLPGAGLNIAYEAVDRHAGGPRRDRVALRWLGKRGQVRDYTWAHLAELCATVATEHHTGGTSMAAITPWTGFKREIDRLFDRMASDDWDLPALMRAGDWAPSLDFAESKDAYVAKFEVPGIDPKAVQVTVDNGVLTVKGEKRQEKEQKEEQYYRLERSYGSFVRSVRLPGPVDSGKISASSKNGVLTVTLPKTTAAKSAAIPVTIE